MITILADENVESRIVNLLRENGYQVQYISESNQGISDSQVLDQAVRAIHLLLTADKDFGELHYRYGQVHHGVLFYRLSKMTTLEKAQIILEAIQANQNDLVDAFTVLTNNKIRIRRP
ncbi:DUF5615 family PIN-like protein [Larkinella sp. VNQ87]|uniref:DUF5615 family PIN-like protein n=1 Tax=Larkinella sp. VNQ87 TaxID=3400921 RepID=UPI003BFEB9D2